MSRKISIQEKRKWLDLYDQGETEIEIASQTKHDVRTIIKGIEEASKDRRLASAETEMLRNALFKHQDQLTAVLNNIATMLVLPSHSLEIRERREDILAPIPLSGALLKHVSKEEMVLEIHDESKLEWDLLKEHLKQEKLWDSIRQWRKALVDHVFARWQFKQGIKLDLAEDTYLRSLHDKDSKKADTLLRELVELLYDVVTQRILGIQNATNVENAIDDILASYDATAEFRQKTVSLFSSLPTSEGARRVTSTYAILGDITRAAKRQADEILLLGMITGKCRVCRRLGQ